MRYIILLVAVAIIYVVLARSSSITPAATAISESMNAANPQASPGASPAGHADALKAPLDRANAVLDQVKKQKSQEQF
jgi:hypothetical protein